MQEITNSMDHPAASFSLDFLCTAHYHPFIILITSNFCLWSCKCNVFLRNQLKWKARQAFFEIKTNNFKVLCHKKRLLFCMLTKKKLFDLSLSVESNSAQHNSIKERNRMTLQGRTANVPVAKQWQTAVTDSRTSALPGRAGKDVQASYCNAVKHDNKILSCSAARGFQQANTTRQGFVQVFGKLLANVQTNNIQKCSQAIPGPTRTNKLLPSDWSLRNTDRVGTWHLN